MQASRREKCLAKCTAGQLCEMGEAMIWEKKSRQGEPKNSDSFLTAVPVYREPAITSVPAESGKAEKLMADTTQASVMTSSPGQNHTVLGGTIVWRGELSGDEDVLIEGQGPEAGDTLYLNDQAGTGVLTYTMSNEITGTRQLANGQQWPVDTTTFYRTVFFMPHLAPTVAATDYAGNYGAHPSFLTANSITQPNPEGPLSKTDGKNVTITKP